VSVCPLSAAKHGSCHARRTGWTHRGSCVGRRRDRRQFRASRRSLVAVDFAAGIIVGPDALALTFPLAASLTLGTVIHVLLSLVCGVVFVAGLALTFQLSARPWLILVYGMLCGVTVWEVDFLAVLPVIAPNLTGRLDLVTQVWNGILSPRHWRR
jgi:hypothetical protein